MVFSRYRSHGPGPRSGLGRRLSAALASLVLVVSAVAGPMARTPSAVAGTVAARRVGSAMPVAIASTLDGRGFWVASENGVVTPEGDAVSYGDASALALTGPIDGIARTASGHGYWLFGVDGGIFSFGDAVFYGSTGNVRLNQPIVGMSATPSGRGYWLVASDGGIFSFGDAVFYGSTGNVRLNQPIVGMSATPSGRGYWLVASDGGIFSFGDAVFYGSTGNVRLNQPIVGMSATPSGRGYWLVASDGGIFNYGDAGFFGSGGGRLPLPTIGMVVSGNGQGYWLVLNNGQVSAFGNAQVIVTTPVLSNAPCVGNPAGRKLLVVSISQQQLWACQGGQILTTSAVTTGKYITPHNVNHSTPRGTFQVYSKQTTRFLNGCDPNACWHEFVNFWMPFDGQVGLHDAPWQTFAFGSPLYATNGSEGCVRLPEKEMIWVYSWAPLGTTVTVRS